MKFFYKYLNNIINELKKKKGKAFGINDPSELYEVDEKKKTCNLKLD